MKTVYLFNHYAATMFLDKGGRHYQFALNLINRGYKVIIFAASSVHNTDINLSMNEERYTQQTLDKIPFVFIKTRSYQGNGLSRILNMLDYYFGLIKTVKKFSPPDVILASSVHPLTCLAGIKLGKKFRIPVISEIRDLWPESIVAYNVAKKNNPAIKLLYCLEKYIYTKSDAVIFTMQGGKDYIIEKHWDKSNGGPVDLSKIYHINNGIDLDGFNYNKQNCVYPDFDLNDTESFKVVYAGSVRKVNNLIPLLKAAAELKAMAENKIKFLIYGSGDETDNLKKSALELGLDNVVFKGRVDKSFIPSIVSRADLCFLGGDYSPIMRYGVSLNKLFDYIASGKPILSCLNAEYDLIKLYDIGISVPKSDPKDLADAICLYKNMDKTELSHLSERAQAVAKKYDYKNLTSELIEVINGLEE